MNAVKPFIGAQVRILARLDDALLLTRAFGTVRDEDYLGMVTDYNAAYPNPWRVIFADEYGYFTEDELEVIE